MNRWMNGQKDRFQDGCMIEQTTRQTLGQIDGSTCIDGWIHGLTDGWVGGWTDARMAGQTDTGTAWWMDGWMDSLFTIQTMYTSR